MKKSLIITVVSLLCLLLFIGSSCTNSQKPADHQDDENLELEEVSDEEMEADESEELELEMNEAMMEGDIDTSMLELDTIGLEE